MADMNRNQIRARGDRARVMLEDTAMREAIEAVEEDLRNRMLTTDLSEPDKRELLYAEYCGLRRVIDRARRWAGEAAQIASEEESNG